MADEKLSPAEFPVRAKPKRAAIYTRVSTGDHYLFCCIPTNLPATSPRLTLRRREGSVGRNVAFSLIARAFSLPTTCGVNRPDRSKN